MLHVLWDVQILTEIFFGGIILTALSHNGYTNLKNDKPQSFGEKLLYSKMKSMKQMKCNNLNRKSEHVKNDR